MYEYGYLINILTALAVLGIVAAVGYSVIAKERIIRKAKEEAALAEYSETTFRAVSFRLTGENTPHSIKVWNMTDKSDPDAEAVELNFLVAEVDNIWKRSRKLPPPDCPRNALVKYGLNTLAVRYDIGGKAVVFGMVGTACATPALRHRISQILTHEITPRSDFDGLIHTVNNALNCQADPTFVGDQVLRFKKRAWD
jgi:hypothetical protein